MRNKILVGVGIVIYILIIFIPLITKGNIYNHIVGYDQPRSDFRDYTAILNNVANGQEFTDIGYPARVIIGYPIVFIHNISHIDMDTLYIAFCFLCFSLAGITVYFAMKYITNFSTAILSIVISFWCATGILSLFYFGMIAHIINMYIILPLIIYFVFKWFEFKKLSYLVFGILLSVLFTIFHFTGVYLPFLLITIIAGLGIFKIINKKINIKRYMFTALLILAISVIGSVLVISLTKISWEMIFNNIASYFGSTNATHYSNSPLSSWFFISNYLSLHVFMILLFVVGYMVFKRKDTSFDVKNGTLLFILCCFMLVLGIGTFSNLSPEPVRTAVDLSAIIALIVALLLNNAVKHKMIKIGCYVFLSTGVINNLILWIR